MIGFSFAGETVLVTGGSGGIGDAIARGFEEGGAAAYRLDLEPPTGGSARFLRTDVTRRQEVDAAVSRAVHETGRLDAVIHAAGIVRDHALWNLADDDWRSVLAVNLDGAFHLLRAAAPVLRRERRGSVVLVSSINAERGKFGQANYAASKAGLHGLAKSAARELGSAGVRVNVVAPGFVDTPMTRPLPAEVREAALRETLLGRIARPEDVASAVLFLCSSLAAHITGQVLRVDGGQYL